MEFHLPIETERLILRRYRKTDAPNIFTDWASDPEVARYLSWKPHRSLKDTYAFLKHNKAEWKVQGHLGMGMECKESGRLIGGIGFTLESQARVQFGYAIGRAHWGKGYTTEAMKALLKVVFAEPSMYRAYAMCVVPNKGSARVMEKVGMQYEGTLRQSHILPNVSEEVPQDMSVYAILRADFYGKD